MENTQTTDSQIETDLRARAEAADRGESLPNQTAGNQGAEQKSEPSTKTGQDSQTQKQTGTDQSSADPTDHQQPAKPAEGQEQKQSKPESDYARFQKEKERYARNWQELQASKQQIVNAQAALERERQELQRLRNQSQVTVQQLAQDQGRQSPLAKYTDADLWSAAEQFEEAGNGKMAAQVRAELQRRAEGLRQQQQQPAELPRQEQQLQGGIPREQFIAQWQSHLEALKVTNPELKDTKSPLFTEVQELLKNPYFSQKPTGIQEAVHAARVSLDARSVPELRKRLETQEKELTGLRKATSPGGGSTESRGRAQKPLSEMSDAEAEQFIRSQAALVDSSG